MGTELKKPTTYDELYPGRFLKAGLLKGKKPTLTITDVDIEELESEGKMSVKCIISFAETKMKLVACKTNGMCLKGMFGYQLSEWKGKRVALFADTWNGEPCIRIWGSPDIAEDMEVEVKLPRKRPMKKTMHKVGGKTPMPVPPVPTAQPEEDDSLEPGSEG